MNRCERKTLRDDEAGSRNPRFPLFQNHVTMCSFPVQLSRSDQHTGERSGSHAGLTDVRPIATRHEGVRTRGPLRAGSTGFLPVKVRQCLVLIGVSTRLVMSCPWLTCPTPRTADRLIWHIVFAMCIFGSEPKIINM
jgi:hypothetical protein